MKTHSSPLAKQLALAVVIIGLVAAAIFTIPFHSPAPKQGEDPAALAKADTGQHREATSSAAATASEETNYGATVVRPAPATAEDIERFVNRPLAQSGEKIEPQVELADGSVQTPIVNEVGEMEFVYVQPREKVKVSIRYPEGKVGEKVIVASYDGGVVNGKEREASVIALDANKTIQFEYEAGADWGRFQIALEKGADEKVFRVWSGRPAPMRKALQ